MQYPISMVKKHLSISIFWRYSILLVVGLTYLIMGHAAAPAVAQPRIIEQFGDINNPQNIRAIQNALRRLGYNISVDGIFGNETRAAVLSFQRANNLPAIGVVDNITANAIFARVQGVDIPFSSDGTRGRFCTDLNNRNEICAYVVLIPGDNSRFLEIRRQLLVSSNTILLAENMVLEDHPRGLFIRISQHLKREQAEVVANVLRNNISPNFRVEYLPTVTPISSRG